MHNIDLQSWPRRRYFEFFKDWAYPHFNLCANLEITDFYAALRQRGVSFTVGFVYALARAANEIPEFRYRIRGEGVIEHEVVHPSTTILAQNELFSFCLMPYSPDFQTFAAQAAKQIALVKEQPTLEDPPGEDNLLFMTAIPWVSFTSFMHPIDLHPVDSVPRFAWGKYFKEGERLMIPLGVQAHHALMDGIHMGKFYTKLESFFHEPEMILGER